MPQMTITITNIFAAPDEFIVDIVDSNMTTHSLNSMTQGSQDTYKGQTDYRNRKRVKLLDCRIIKLSHIKLRNVFYR